MSSDYTPTALFHRYSKRSDAQLTLGLALGFGGAALLLTAILSFLFGYYLGRRRALKTLGGGQRGAYSAVGVAVDLGADGDGVDALHKRKPNKLRAGSRNSRARTASSYSYTGLTNTDVDSMYSRGTNNVLNNVNNVPTGATSTSMQVQMPPMSSDPVRVSDSMQVQRPTSNPMNSHPSNTSNQHNGLYGGWYGGGIPPGNPATNAPPPHHHIPSPSVYVEPPPERQASGPSANPNGPPIPTFLRPGAWSFGHGTPLSQISEAPSAQTAISALPPPETDAGPPSDQPAAQNQQRDSVYVEMPTLTPGAPYVPPNAPQPQSTSNIGPPAQPSNASSGSGTAGLASSPDAIAATVNRVTTMSKPPSYPYHELVARSLNGSDGGGSSNGRNSAGSNGGDGASVAGSSKGNNGGGSSNLGNGEGSSTSGSPNRRTSKMFGPRAVPAQTQARAQAPVSPMYVEMPPTSPPSAPGPY